VIKVLSDMHDDLISSIKSDLCSEKDTEDGQALSINDPDVFLRHWGQSAEEANDHDFWFFRALQIMASKDPEGQYAIAEGFINAYQTFKMSEDRTDFGRWLGSHSADYLLPRLQGVRETIYNIQKAQIPERAQEAAAQIAKLREDDGLAGGLEEESELEGTEVLEGPRSLWATLEEEERDLKGIYKAATAAAADLLAPSARSGNRFGHPSSGFAAAAATDSGLAVRTRVAELGRVRDQ
jgi:hypothetical protein